MIGLLLPAAPTTIMTRVARWRADFGIMLARSSEACLSCAAEKSTLNLRLSRRVLGQVIADHIMLIGEIKQQARAR